MSLSDEGWCNGKASSSIFAHSLRLRARSGTLNELLAFFVTAKTGGVSVGPRRTVFEYYKRVMGTGFGTQMRH